jgi:uncharacterized membrane protein YkvI
MRKLGFYELAFTFIGCFLGAGFVSGQELWQFFGSFGAAGIFGAAAAMLVMCLFAALLMRITRATGVTELDRMLFFSEHRVLGAVLVIAEISFMFDIYVVMLAGAGSLVEQLTGLGWTKPAFSFVFAAVVTAASLAGIGGIARVFARVMPFLLALAIAISTAAVIKSGGVSFGAAASDNPLLANMPAAALSFVSYNFFCAIGFIGSLGSLAKSGRGIFGGAALGALLMFLMALALVSSMTALPDSVAAELPMIEVSAAVHPALKYIYALLLLFAMFSASMSVFLPIPDYFARFAPVRRRKTAFACLLSLAAWAASGLGFSRLIGTLFPVYGYLAVLVLALVIVQSVRLRKIDRNTEK